MTKGEKKGIAIKIQQVSTYIIVRLVIDTRRAFYWFGVINISCISQPVNYTKFRILENRVLYLQNL